MTISLCSTCGSNKSQLEASEASKVSSNTNLARSKEAHPSQSKFYNTEITYQTGLSNLWQIIKAYITTKRESPIPKAAIPVKVLSAKDLLDAPNNSLFKLGHSSILLKLEQQLILLDPVFSERASPVQWAGPKRFHQPPISVEDLPQISTVVISHDHYDHLDEGAIKALNDKVEYFVVPLSVGKYLRKWGVESSKIVELDWWQSTSIGEVEFIATPTQHFSGRGILDRDETLWASWVVRSPESNVFFSGDSGYFSGFKTIGEKYGPFDLAMIETGAYNELWSEIHMLPEESIQAHFDVQGKVMMPVHNGTFDLALHDWDEPLERVYQLAEEKGAYVAMPTFGQHYQIHSKQTSSPWWRAVK